MINYKDACNKIIDSHNIKPICVAITGSILGDSFNSSSDIDLLFFCDEEIDVKTESIQLLEREFELTFLPVQTLPSLIQNEESNNRSVISDLIENSEYLQGEEELYHLILDTVSFFKQLRYFPTDVKEFRYHVYSIKRMMRDINHENNHDALTSIISDITYHISVFLMKRIKSGNGSGKWKKKLIESHATENEIYSNHLHATRTYFSSGDLSIIKESLNITLSKLECLLCEEENMTVEKTLIRNGIFQLHTNSIDVVRHLINTKEHPPFFKLSINPNVLSIIFYDMDEPVECLKRVNDSCVEYCSLHRNQNIKVNYTYRKVPVYLFGHGITKSSFEKILRTLSKEVFNSAQQEDIGHKVNLISQVIICSILRKHGVFLNQLYNAYFQIHIERIDIEQYEFITDTDDQNRCEMLNLIADYASNNKPTDYAWVSEIIALVHQVVQHTLMEKVEAKKLLDPLSLSVLDKSIGYNNELKTLIIVGINALKLVAYSIGISEEEFVVHKNIVTNCLSHQTSQNEIA